MANLREKFGRLVAFHRHQRGLTQAELAEEVGVSVDMISKVEAGRSGVRFPVLESLATALRVDVAQLFGGSPSGPLSANSKMGTLMVELATLSEEEQAWISDLVRTALQKP